MCYVARGEGSAGLHTELVAADSVGHDERMPLDGSYAVSAPSSFPIAGPIRTRLTDGSIAAQRADGADIVAAMQRARARRTAWCAGPRPAIARRRSSMTRYALDRYFHWDRDRCH